MEILRQGRLNDLVVPFVRLIVEDRNTDTYNEHTYETKRTRVFILLKVDNFVVISHSSIHITYYIYILISSSKFPLLEGTFNR
jgi:hypothetical protein